MLAKQFSFLAVIQKSFGCSHLTWSKWISRCPPTDKYLLLSTVSTLHVWVMKLEALISDWSTCSLREAKMVRSVGFTQTQSESCVFLTHLSSRLIFVATLNLPQCASLMSLTEFAHYK